MDASPFTAVARVVKTHGLDGEVQAEPLVRSVDASNLTGAELWPVPPRSVPRPLHVTDARPTGGGCLLAFYEVQDVSTAKRLVGTTLLGRASEFPQQPEDDGYDVVGYEVVDEQRGGIGTIIEVLITGANDVWVVRGALGEVLVPVIDDVVVAIDRDKRIVSVRLLPGLIDED